MLNVKLCRQPNVVEAIKQATCLEETMKTEKRKLVQSQFQGIPQSFKRD